MKNLQVRWVLINYLHSNLHYFAICGILLTGTFFLTERETNQVNNRTLIPAIVFLIFAVFWSFFIWSFSLKDAADSTADSDKVVELVNEVIEQVTGKESQVGSYIIRKLGHFSEFCVLGILLFCTVHFFGARGVLRRYLFASAPGLAVAVTDECIQLFSKGRSAQLTDVLLDFSGVLSGLTLSMIVLWFFYKYIRKKKDFVI